jgi:hypothetical protein
MHIDTPSTHNCGNRRRFNVQVVVVIHDEWLDDDEYNDHAICYPILMMYNAINNNIK